MLDVALLALAEQENALRDLRTRAGTLLAASALTVSFLGTQSLDRDGLSLVAWLAIGTFVMSLAASIYVLVPESEMSFSLDAAKLDRDGSSEANLPVLQAHVARSILDRRVANQPHLDRLALGYRRGAFALLAQAALWVVGLSPIV